MTEGMQLTIPKSRLNLVGSRHIRLNKEWKKQFNGILRILSGLRISFPVIMLTTMIKCILKY